MPERRDWSGAELEALRAAATVLGAAVTRQGLDQHARATEARYRAFVEHIPAVTYTDIVEEDGARLEFLSPQMEEVLGFSRERYFDDPGLLVLSRPPRRSRPRDRGRARTGPRSRRSIG